MNKEDERIVTSTGKLGVERRTYARIYCNAKTSINNFDVLTEISRRFFGIVDRHGKKISRAVLRFITDDPTMQKILTPGSSVDVVEVAVPIQLNGFGDTRRWLIFVGRNNDNRVSIVSKETMIENTREYCAEIKSPIKRIGDVVRRGYSFRSDIQDWTSSLLELWGETFSWSRNEIINLSQRIEDQKNISPEERKLWISMITSNGQVIAAVMAERLRMSSEDNFLDLVESTEWRTKESFQNQGLVTAALVHLNAQIIHDLKNPFIFAECSYMTRSDRAAHGAGFIVPQREILGRTIPQILEQNVQINDGLTPFGLRDFTFLYLPTQSIKELYHESNLDQIRRITGLK